MQRFAFVMHLVGVLTIHELSFLELGISTLLLRGPKMLEMVASAVTQAGPGSLDGDS